MSEDKLERQSDFEALARIENKLELLNQSLEKTLAPKVEELRNCVFGVNRDEGLVRQVQDNKQEIEKHKEAHKSYWLFLVIVAGFLSTVGGWVVNWFRGK